MNRKIGITVLTIIITFSSIFQPLYQAYATGESWLTNWNYRQSMSITGSSNGTQTNYQMPFEARFGNNYITPKGDGWVQSMRNNPSSTVYNGYTYVVYQGPKTTDDGDPYITRMNNTTGDWDTPVKVGVNNAGVGDLIATPVVLVRSDGGKVGKILVAWGGDSTAGHLRDIQWIESTYAENITAWGTAASVGFTDGQWYNLFQAATGDIYIHAFSTTTGQYKRVSRKMVSGGSTWGTQTTIYDLTGITRVVHVGQPSYDSVNGIFWFPLVAGNVEVATHYHYLWVVGFKPSDGKFYDIAGNGIAPTLTSDNLTNAAYKYQVFVWDGANQRTLDEPSIALDSNGYPHVAYEYSEDVGNTVWSERYISWNGSAWSSPNTVTGGVGGITGQIFWNAVNDLDIIGASTSTGANKDFLKYNWNGSNWTTSYILTDESMPDTLQFNNVNKVEGGTSNLKVTFANWDTGSTRTNQRLYGYGNAGIVQFKGAGFLMMNGNGKTDFSDVRFTNSTGNETLAYWTESKRDSQYMSGIVKIDSIAGNPTSTVVYGYYGNVAASSSSDPNNTFSQFDNFERGNNGDAIGGNWTGVTGNVSINTSIFNGGTRSGRWTTDVPNGLAAIPYTANNATDILAYIYKTNAAISNLAHGDDSHTIYIQITSAEDVTYYNGAAFIDTGLNILPDAWQSIGVDNITWGNPTTYTITINGLLSASASTTYTSNDADNALRFDTSAGHLYVDDVSISKEVSPKPVWGATGAEETITGAPTVTTQAASSVSQTTAIANGTITATNGGNATSVFVQYGLSAGNYTANFTNSGNYGAAAFTVNMTGLSPSTTYYIRAGATNSVGNGYGGEVSFTTLGNSPSAPTDVSATDGTSTSNVTVTWTKSAGATSYTIWRDSTNVTSVGDVATYGDTGADAGTITAGTASASDGTSNITVTLSLAGESVNNGTTHTYRVQAHNASGSSANSTSDTGYRGVGALSYQWQRSAADADAAYGNIAGATTDPYSDTGGVTDPDGRYYQAVLSASGATGNTSSSNRGYMLVASGGGGSGVWDPGTGIGISANVTTAAVPDNANNWIWMQNNSMPYANYIKHSVGGTEKLWYQPNTMILGTVLPDRSGTQAGVITWGANPAGVVVSLGSLISSAQTALISTTTTPPRDILPTSSAPDLFGDGTVSGNALTSPIRPLVTMISDNGNMTELQVWRLYGFGLWLVMTVWVMGKVRKHQLITGVVSAMTIIVMIVWNHNIFPIYLGIVAVGLIFAGWVSERSPVL